MKNLIIPIICVALAGLSPALAGVNSVGNRYGSAPRKPSSTHVATAGLRGVKTTTWTEKPPSKQDLADEKKLEHDMQICKGC